MMSRRKFVIAAATRALPGPGRAGTRPPALPTTTAASTVNPLLARILGLAALAPSSHNVQPWTVHVAGPRELAVAIASERRVPEIDPVGRELVLSVGCFLENLSQAASAEALEAEIKPSEVDAADGVLARVRLVPAPVRPGGPDRIWRRWTLRSGHLPPPLAGNDAAFLLESA